MKRILLLLPLFVLCLGCSRKEGTVVSMETSMGKIRIRLYDETVVHRENMVKMVREGYYNGLLFHRVIKDFMIQCGDPESRMARKGQKLGEGAAPYTLKAEILPAYFHRRGVLAAAREGDDVNPMRNSSGSHFYIVQGRKFTTEELERIEQGKNRKLRRNVLRRMEKGNRAALEALSVAGDSLGLKQMRDSLSALADVVVERHRFRFTPEQLETYRTVGGTPHLDREYTVFGEVVEGMEVVDAIAAVGTDANDRPVEDVVIRRMTIE